MRISDWSSDVCSSDLPAGVDGIDLSPVFGGQAVTERPDLYWAYGKEGAPKKTPQPAMEHDRAPPFAVREGDWKLLAGFGGTDPELFNLATDPTESTDVAASRSEEHTSELKSLMRITYAVFC